MTKLWVRVTHLSSDFVKYRQLVLHLVESSKISFSSEQCCTAKSRKRKIEHESFIKKKICCYPAQGSTRMQEEWGIIDAVP
ncbi:hypothetical protein Ahy_A03g010110 isoform F [Arachis hypogaea]|uniref:Uncharacterized protein n=1 Tax=Arachis hypogaea TaxID=3818 RepID=A0A445DL93_ARAHY|nr:hypothetical protein Ahy_A03g010110 isoform F [Arachis hypogaea]